MPLKRCCAMDAPMKVVIVGAGRRHNGIGEYIAKYFSMGGAEVSGVLGTSVRSAAEAATRLDGYGIRAGAFTDFSEMIRVCRPDAVAIASPSATHAGYIERCLGEGLHIFCEKPFLSPDIPDAPSIVEDMAARAGDRGIVIGMNSQWPFCLSAYEQLCGELDPSAVESFTIRLSPLARGRDMIPDSVPHALSLLYCAVGSGSIGGLAYQGGDDSLGISFTYRGDRTTCRVRIELVRESTQPRTLAFGFNGCMAARAIDLDTYTIYLTCRDKILKIADPLELSVRNFLIAAGSGREPLIGSGHILETSRLLQQIFTEYAPS